MSKMKYYLADAVIRIDDLAGKMGLDLKKGHPRISVFPITVKF